ncbi:MAG: ankyrin repeat domain-containing protein [Deltaproteobacteria bacterium]|nr:ankyrin repeat domain-containing protein [Deltaproteobacteria bacterium]
MKTLRMMLLLLVTGAIAVGCAFGTRSLISLTDPAFSTPVANPMQRLELQGFSFLPPTGENWFIVSPSHPSHPVETLLPAVAQGLVIAKKHRESPPTRPEDAQTIFAFVATAPRFNELTLNPTEYLQNKAQEREKQYKEETKTGRFRPVDFKASIDSSLGTNCLRIDSIIEDHGVPQFPGSVFIISDHRFLCPHPDFPILTVTIGYSQRYLQGGQHLPVETEIAPFFKSLMVTPIQPLEAMGGEGTLSPEAARKELDRLYIHYTPGSLLTHAQGGNSGAVKLLLTAGLNPNEAVMGITPLMIVASAGHTDIIQILLAKGANVNAKETMFGVTALMWVALTGHTDNVKVLLAAGADVNASNKNGETALMMAADRGHTDTVEALLAAGARVNSKQNRGQTALMWAAYKGHTGIVKTLLAHGAEVNVKDKMGNTALVLAVFNGITDSVKVLLDYGADVNTKAGNGQTVLLVAKEKGYTDIAELLMKAGADEIVIPK